MKKLIILLITLGILTFSLVLGAPEATVKLRASHRVMMTGVEGLTEIPLIITVTASGGVWLEINLNGPDYQSSSASLVPDHTIRHTFLRLPAGVYDALAFVTNNDGKILASDSQTVEIR